VETMQIQLNEIIEDFELFDDELAKYEYIVDIGKSLTPLKDDEKSDVYLIQGCTSQVWVIPSLVDGKMNFKADSNTVIVKGLVAILLKIFSNRTSQEILSFNLEELSKLGLAEIVTPTRQNGFTSIVKKIIEYTKGMQND